MSVKASPILSKLNLYSNQLPNLSPVIAIIAIVAGCIDSETYNETAPEHIQATPTPIINDVSTVTNRTFCFCIINANLTDTPTIAGIITFTKNPITSSPINPNIYFINKVNRQPRIIHI